MPSDCSSSNEASPTPKFALVSYIPQPLAGFLDQLRLKLDPISKPRAHVTILPPRELCASPERAAREIRRLASRFQPFTVRLGQIAKFPVSNVIYVELASGCEMLHQMYRAMNCGAAKYTETFHYSPHVTVAQRLRETDVDRSLEEARVTWANCPFEKSFCVDTLAFVRSLDCACWTDMEDVPLAAGPAVPGVTRTGLVERASPA